MPTFTPDTYETLRIPEEVNHHPRFSLWRWIDGVTTEYVVLITSGVASPSPGRVSPSTTEMAAVDTGSGENGQGIFRGGRTYTVTAAEDTILTAAGYTVT